MELLRLTSRSKLSVVWDEEEGVVIVICAQQDCMIRESVVICAQLDGMIRESVVIICAQLDGMIRESVESVGVWLVVCHSSIFID